MSVIRDVVNILPIFEGKVLMQLRDNDNTIVFPNQWGFFGGSIEDNETALEAAMRELEEEISFSSKNMIFLHSKYVASLNIHTTTYYCYLENGLKGLILKEGMDFKLTSKSEILSKEVYSEKFKIFFKVVDNPFVYNTVNELGNKLL